MISDAGSTTPILLVEDDIAAAAEMTNSLSRNGAGWTIWHATSAADARAILQRQQPALIVLDLTLPDVHGLVFCTQLKTTAPRVPFMICSTLTTTQTVLALKLGADDVVGKPVELAELEARIEAVLGRHGAPTQTSPVRHPLPTHERWGSLHIDPQLARATTAGGVLNLTPTEFRLLTFMARQRGRIVSRQELADGVWGDSKMARSRTLDACVRRINTKLTGHDAPRMLSIRGLGFQLAPCL